jgi:hypothetical protein
VRSQPVPVALAAMCAARWSCGWAYAGSSSAFVRRARPTSIGRPSRRTTGAEVAPEAPWSLSPVSYATRRYAVPQEQVAVELALGQRDSRNGDEVSSSIGRHLEPTTGHFTHERRDRDLSGDWNPRMARESTARGANPRRASRPRASRLSWAAIYLPGTGPVNLGRRSSSPTAARQRSLPRRRLRWFPSSSVQLQASS